MVGIIHVYKRAYIDAYILTYAFTYMCFILTCSFFFLFSCCVKSYHSDSSITNSVYQDHITPQHDHFMRPPTHNKQRLRGVLTASLRPQLQASLSAQLQAQLRPQVPAPLSSHVPLSKEVPQFQSHCESHSPPSYVDDYSHTSHNSQNVGVTGSERAQEQDREFGQGQGLGQGLELGQAGDSENGSDGGNDSHIRGEMSDVVSDNDNGSSLPMSMVTGTDVNDNYRMRWMNRVQLSLTTGDSISISTHLQ